MASLDTSADDSVLVITRIFDAPKELVWQAWANPEMRVQWIGPRDYPAVSVESDFRVGGKFQTVLKGVETDELLPHAGVYRDIVEHTLMAFTFAWERDKGQQDMLVTLTFEDAGKGKTKFTLRQERFNSVEERDGHNGGWTSSFDRLDDFLAENVR